MSTEVTACSSATTPLSRTFSLICKYTPGSTLDSYFFPAGTNSHLLKPLIFSVVEPLPLVQPLPLLKTLPLPLPASNERQAGEDKLPLLWQNALSQECRDRIIHGAGNSPVPE